MTRKIAFLLLLLVASPATAHLRKYGQATTIYFPLVELAGVNYTTSAVCDNSGAGDVRISKNGAAFVEATACFVHVGLGIYSLAISAAEASASEIVIAVKDQTNPKVWLDDVVSVSTYGNTLAQHAVDLDSEAFLGSQSSLFRGTVETTDFGATTSQFEADIIDAAGVTVDLSSIAVPDGANRLNGRVVVFISGDLAGSAATIADSVMANGRVFLTVSGVTEPPEDGAEFVIF